MDERSLQSLEYYKVLEILAEFCVNTETKERALQTRPITSKVNLTTMLDDLDDSVRLFLQNGSYRVGRVDNIIPLLERARIESVLDLDEFLKISSLLQVISELLNYYREATQENNYSKLENYFQRFSSLSQLHKKIKDIILDEETIADNASTELFKIRKAIENKQAQITSQLERIIHSSKNEKALQDKIISIRNGHYVVPVKESHRSQIPGVIVDRSSSGATVFVEPMVVLELNNQLRDLEIDERKEINRILKALTKEVADVSEELEDNYHVLIDIDYLFAKALYALDTNSSRVEFSEDGKIELRKARHPLIPKDRVVASNIVLTPDTKILVITGPNTGGKTVILKTMGLLSALAQSGLFIPVGSGSSIRLFENIFADIGDEQSIEQNLSTFSSHLTNIVEILEEADSNSLVLFDELGSGTDPIEGAALAVSILEELKRQDILTFATTHYPEIKEFALSEENVLNASVEFDVETLKPTYRLLLGLPGKSNAFEIASRLGISDSIIQESKKKVSDNNTNFNQILDQVQNELQIAEAKRIEAERMFEEASEAKKKVEKEKKRIEQKSETVLEKANAKARELVEQTQRETQRIYKEIQKIQQHSNIAVDNKHLEALRSDLNETEKSLIKEDRKKKKKNKSLKKEELTKGDRVYVYSLGREAEVLDTRGRKNKVEVSAGPMRLQVDISDLEFIEPKRVKKVQTSVHAKNREMNTRLDLRGKTVAETKSLLDSFVSDALLLGKHHLEIIHGFGTGQVRKAVHDYLRKSQHISSYRLGGPGEGGAGATIVEL